MQSNDHIQNELKELHSILAGVSNKNVYTVPDNYFEVLSLDILLAINPESNKIYDDRTVPVGYFDSLAETILNKINAAEIITQDASPLLASLKGINVYRVPESYFDNLTSSIINKLAQPAKVVVMKKRMSFFNYAAAAVITGIMGLSIMSIYNKRETGELNSKPGMVMAQAKNILKTNNFDAVLATVTDAEIVKYLHKSGQDVNAALVASIADDKNLPDQIDYLTDDKTLDNLLNGLNIVETTN